MNDDKLTPELDFNEYFESAAFKLLKLGNVVLPTGSIVLSDPLFSLPHGGTAAFETKVAPGEYPVTICVFGEKRKGDHFMAAKISITNARAESYKLAMRPGENPAKLGYGETFGYPVETGLASFCDESTAKGFKSFCKQWGNNNKGKNIYDNYFADFFAQSVKKSPKFQTESGSYINWILPQTKNNVLMFDSGFGTGVYSAYWGYDANGEICSLVAPFISTEELD